MSDQEFRNISDGFRFQLKSLASRSSLKLNDLKEIIAFCGAFFSQSLPQTFGKSFNAPFMVEGLAGKTFRLERVNKIESQLKLIAEVSQDKTIDSEQKKLIIAELERKKDKFLQDYIFLSDLIAFLEQVSVQLAKFLDQEHKQELAKLGDDFFSRIALAPKLSSREILLKELKKLEDSPALWQKVNSDLTHSMLALIESQIQKQFTKDEVDGQKEKAVPTSVVPPKVGDITGSEDISDSVEEGIGEKIEEEVKELKQTLPEDFSKEFNLARLDDHSKLYIRSLAIIALNQSLLIQFNHLTTEQLAEMGFDNPPNFNQLSLENRQQLLNIAFSKIENFLASGQYDLTELINKPSLRISFSKDVALKIMTDIRGGEIFARELGKLTQSGLDKKGVAQQLINNQNQLLLQEQVGEKINVSAAFIPTHLKNRVDILSTQEAEAIFQEIDSRQELKNGFIKNIANSFTRVTKDNFLKEWQKIVANDKTAMDKSFLAKENILPIIDVFIQQNYPVDYIERFDWRRFQAHFGQEIIQQNTYLAQERRIKDLLASYWKTQRAEWSRTIHQGIDNEFYTPEDIEEMWTEFDEISQVKRADKHIVQKHTIYLEQIKQQAQLNIVDADIVTQTKAGFPQEKINYNNFSKEQLAILNELNRVYQQNFLNIINAAGPRAQTVTLTYYFPEEKFSAENIFLQVDTIPQFSAYDLGVLNYNQAFDSNEDGQYAFTRGFGEDGGIESQLQASFEGVKNLVGKGVDFLGEKAVRAGLTYATGGAFEALPEPIKQMIEQVAWGEIKKRVEPLLKIITVLLTPMIIGILKVIDLFRGGGQTSVTLGSGRVVSAQALPSTQAAAGSQAVAPSTTITETAVPNQLAERAAAAESQLAAQASTGQVAVAQPALAEIASGAMATAGQAVITAFSLAAGGMLVYHTIINSAFLTEFPTGQYGSVGGSAVFCNDVVVGNLTYYNQKDYNNITICGGSCTFGSSACGPVAIAMILNEDPIQMSSREGYLVPGGCGTTSCSGTAADPLINTLNNNGVLATSVPTPSGSPGQITDDIANYLAEGNLLFVLGYVRGFGHYTIVTCVEEPGYVVTYDPYWGQNAVHKVVSTGDEGLVSGSNHIYIRNMWIVKN